ncbi:MBL fold metallo-hydrolase [Streptomyces sp. NPDC020719]|uniref:MBL fold metallo-hydrolase n=1 Tax=Streptomyces sp. NPDC020719 TaxID=3154896 RepID=UPI0033EF9A7A
MNLPTALAPIADGIHAWIPDVSGSWGYANCLLIASDTQAALVDTPYDGQMTRTLLAAAAAVLPAGARVETIVNTHANGDHCFGNSHFPDAQIISTQASLDHLCTEPDPGQMHHLTHNTPADEPLGWYMRRHFGHYQYHGIQLAPPTLTFTGHHQFTVGATRVELTEVGPAHTMGDLIVHLPDHGVVCAGDIVFIGDHPAHWQGPLSGVIAACDTILRLEPQTVIPGHGPIVGIAGLLGYRQYLHDLEGAIHDGYTRGHSAQETAEQLVRAGFYAHLGLEERLMITTAMEHRHLDGDNSAPDLVALANRAATWAFHRHHAHVPAPASLPAAS